MVFLNFWLVVIPVERSWWLVVVVVINVLACGGLWWLVVACGGLWWLVVACGGLCVVLETTQD